MTNEKKPEQPIALWWQYEEDETDTQHKLPTGCRLNRVKFEIIDHVKESVDCDGSFSEFAHGGVLTIGLEDGTTVEAELDVDIEPTIDVWFIKPRVVAAEPRAIAADATPDEAHAILKPMLDDAGAP